MSRYEYVRDPETIYRMSSELVAAATDVAALPSDLATLAYRLVHACGMPDIVGDLRWHGSPVGIAGRALRAGACVLVDCEMVADGVIRTRLPAANTVLCSLNDPRTREIQQRERTTRSAAAVELWRDHLPGAVVAIGNAPTALFRLLETLTDAPELCPATILAFPGRLRRRGRIETRAGGSRTRHPLRHTAGSPGRKRHGRGGRQCPFRPLDSMRPGLALSGHLAR